MPGLNIRISVEDSFGADFFGDIVPGRKNRHIISVTNTAWMVMFVGIELLTKSRFLAAGRRLHFAHKRLLSGKQTHKSFGYAARIDAN